MSWPAPTRADHDNFCRAEGWEKVRNAKGETGTHHVTYELHLPNGRILRTRISHPPGHQAYGSSFWKHILRDQLEVSEEEFWACIKETKLPARGLPVTPANALPVELVHLLRTRVGLEEREIAGMSKEEAIEQLQRYWAS